MAKKQESKIAKDILRRVKWLYAIFLLLGVCIIAKVLWLQLGPNAEELKQKAHSITFERVTLEAERGDILARDGRTLATSVPTYDIRMDFAVKELDSLTFYSSVDSLARSLATFFKDKPSSAYRFLLTSEYAKPRDKRNGYKRISPRRVSFIEEMEIAQFPIFRLGANRGGYLKVQHNRRIKPHGSLAMRTIGHYVNDSLMYGVEGAFNNHLQGTEGVTLMQRISGNFKVPVSDPLNVEPVNGMDVLTTIDVDLQDVAETALREQLRKMNADWGTVVLMEVETGEVHAMANLTRKQNGEIVEDYNYAIGRRIEPGSTFKLATLITLLEDGKMSLDHMIDCENGEARVGERTKRLVKDTHKEGVIPLRRAFEVSSNVGMAKAVNEIYGKEPTRFVNYINKMGFNQKLGIQIGGERSPLVKTPGTKNWDGTSLVMMSYGYALEITPMHTLVLYNAVANGGRMMQPQLVKEIRSYGRTIHSFGGEPLVGSICSKQTIDLVRDCLEGVVDEGTGRILKNPYYTVAAKTGTAQIAFDNGGYMDSHKGRNYLGTMVGYFPADNPKYTLIVAIKTYNAPHRRNTYYGAPLAGPVFKAISDRVYAVNSSWHKPVDTSGEIYRPTAEDIKSGSSEELKKSTKTLKAPLKIERSAAQWSYVGSGLKALYANANYNDIDNNPSPTAPTTEIVDNGRMAVSSSAGISGEVPSVIGMGLKDAIYLLEREGIRVAFQGRGVVVSQSIKAGERAEKGAVVVLGMGN